MSDLLTPNPTYSTEVKEETSPVETPNLLHRENYNLEQDSKNAFAINDQTKIGNLTTFSKLEKRVQTYSKKDATVPRIIRRNQIKTERRQTNKLDFLSNMENKAPAQLNSNPILNKVEMVGLNSAEVYNLYPSVYNSNPTAIKAPNMVNADIITSKRATAQPKILNRILANPMQHQHSKVNSMPSNRVLVGIPTQPSYKVQVNASCPVQSFNVETSNHSKELNRVIVQTSNQVRELSPVLVETSSQVKALNRVLVETSNQVRELSPVLVETSSQVKALNRVLVETSNQVREFSPVLVETSSQANTLKPAPSEAINPFKLLNRVLADKLNQVIEQNNVSRETSNQVKALNHVPGETLNQVKINNHVLVETSNQAKALNHDPGKTSNQFEALNPIRIGTSNQAKALNRVLVETSNQAKALNHDPDKTSNQFEALNPIRIGTSNQVKALNRVLVETSNQAKTLNHVPGKTPKQVKAFHRVLVDKLNQVIAQNNIPGETSNQAEAVSSFLAEVSNKVKASKLDRVKALRHTYGNSNLSLNNSSLNLSDVTSIPFKKQRLNGANAHHMLWDQDLAEAFPKSQSQSKRTKAWIKDVNSQQYVKKSDHDLQQKLSKQNIQPNHSIRQQLENKCINQDLDEYDLKYYCITPELDNGKLIHDPDDDPENYIFSSLENSIRQTQGVTPYLIRNPYKRLPLDYVIQNHGLERYLKPNPYINSLVEKVRLNQDQKQSNHLLPKVQQLTLTQRKELLNHILISRYGIQLDEMQRLLDDTAKCPGENCPCEDTGYKIEYMLSQKKQEPTPGDILESYVNQL